MSTKQQYALVTGASGGIGLEFAWQLARDGYHLILVARNESALNALAADIHAETGVNVEVYARDLARPNAAQALATDLGAGLKRVSLLVNNAGFGLHGQFHELPMDGVAQMMQLNMNTLTELTHLCLPHMMQAMHGEIINIASVASFQPCPNFAVYAATKAYVLSFSEALNIELASAGIKVTAVCPGSTDTNFHKVAGTSHLRAVQLMDSPKKVVQLSLKAVRAGRGSIVTGFSNKAIPLASRLLPRYLMGKTAQLLFKK